MSVGKVTKLADNQFELPMFRPGTLTTAEVVEYIKLGHEIEVVDAPDGESTKDVLAEIALHTVGMTRSGAPDAFDKLRDVDLFDLHAMIEDDEVEEFLSSSSEN